MSEQKSIFQTTKERLLDAFIARPAGQAEFQKFEDEMANQAQIRATHSLLKYRLADKESLHQALAQTLPIYANADIAGSIFQTVKNNIAGVPHIVHIATQFSGVAIMKTYGPEILKICEQELSDQKAELADFVKANSAILTELGLI